MVPSRRANGMLRVRWPSGEELATLPVEDGLDVRALKRALQCLEDVALPRFRQRLLQDDKFLEDDAVLSGLSTPMDLTLVLLPFCDAMQEEVEALDRAVRRGLLSEVERILQRPQAPDLICPHHGLTPLAQACCQGHVEVARLLLEACADKDKKCGLDCRTPLYMACDRGHLEVTRLLLEPGSHPDMLAGPLLRSSTLGHAEMVLLLLKAGADVERFGPLAQAASTNRIEVVRALLEARANPDGAFGLRVSRTPLIEAIAASSKESPCAVSLLLKAKAETGKVYEGRTALGLASSKGDSGIARLLLEAGADKDQVCTRSGETPLGLACCECHEELVRVLLEYRADCEKASAGQTPLALAAGAGHTTILDILLQSNANPDNLGNADSGTTPLLAASTNNHFDIVSLLLEVRADKDQVGKDRVGRCQTPLTMAAGKGHVQIMRLLLAARADMDKAVGPDVYTPLCKACSMGSVDSVRVLLQARADMDKASRGQTPLSVASAKSGKSHLEIVQMLTSTARTDSLALAEAVPSNQASIRGYDEITGILVDDSAAAKQAVQVSFRAREDCRCQGSWNSCISSGARAPNARVITHTGCIRDCFGQLRCVL